MSRWHGVTSRATRGQYKGQCWSICLSLGSGDEAVCTFSCFVAGIKLGVLDGRAALKSLRTELLDTQNQFGCSNLLDWASWSNCKAAPVFSGVWSMRPPEILCGLKCFMIMAWGGRSTVLTSFFVFLSFFFLKTGVIQRRRNLWNMPVTAPWHCQHRRWNAGQISSIPSVLGRLTWSCLLLTFPLQVINVLSHQPPWTSDPLFEAQMKQCSLSCSPDLLTLFFHEHLLTLAMWSPAHTLFSKWHTLGVTCWAKRKQQFHLSGSSSGLTAHAVDSLAGFSPGEPLLRAERYPWTVLLVHLSCTVHVLCVSEARSKRMMAAKPCIDSCLAPT